MIRRLCWAAFAFSAGIAVSHYLLPNEYRLWFGLGCLILTIPAAALHGNVRVRWGLVCIFAALGIFRYAAYQTFTVAPPEAYVGQTMTVTVRVTDFPTDYGTYRSVPVRIEELSNTKVLLYDYGGDLPEVQPGDLLQTEIKFTSATQSRGERTDTYLSKGIYLRGYLKQPATVTGQWGGWMLYAPKYLAKTLQNSYARICPEKTALFLSALTIGEKSGLYNHAEQYVALSSAGIMHIVAVSGMHVAILVSMCYFLFGGRRGCFLSILTIVFFAIMTGLSPSVIRAAFMQTFVILAPLIRRESDSITSMSFALMLLLLVNPGTVGSISLQLSFTAMAGILLVTPRAFEWLESHWKRRGTRIDRLRTAVIVSFSSTLGATVFSTPVAAIHFGSISMYGALTNFLTLWLLPICFMGGFVVSLLGLLFPAVGTLMGKVLSIPVTYIYAVAELISRLPGAVLYLSGNWVAWWLAGTYLLIGVTYFCKRKGNPYHPVIPVCISIGSLCAMLMVTRYTYAQGNTVAAVDVGQGQSIVLLSGTNTVVIDCGGDGGGTAGDLTAGCLKGRGRKEIDLLILTHLHQDHTNGVPRLMERVHVDRLVLPADCDDEDGTLTGILESAERHGTQVLYVSESTDLTLGGMNITAFVSPYAEENQGLILLASCGSVDTLITGDVDQTAETWLIRQEALPDGEILIAGHHGSKNSTSALLLDVFQPETVLISVGYNSYGHPADEVLERLKSQNVTSYRTDESGDIEIRTGQDGEEGNA